MRFWNKETFIALVGVGLSSICMSIGFSRSVEWFMLVHAAIVSFVFIGVFLLLNYVSAWIGDRLEARRRADRELKFAQEREMRKQEEKKRLAAIDPRKSSTAKNDYKNKLIADAEGRYAAMSRDLEAIDREIEHIEALPLDCRCDPRAEADPVHTRASK